jgi:hypothetical protein
MAGFISKNPGARRTIYLHKRQYMSFRDVMSEYNLVLQKTRFTMRLRAVVRNNSTPFRLPNPGRSV